MGKEPSIIIDKDGNVEAGPGADEDTARGVKEIDMDDVKNDGGSSSSGSGGSDKKTAKDFDPDDYPFKKSVSELGEKRREDYGLNEQEQRRVNRGEDPVKDGGGTGYVSYDPEFSGGKGEVTGSGDTRREAAADQVNRAIRNSDREDPRIKRENIAFDQNLSDVNRENARQTRETADQFEKQIDQLPDAEKLNIKDTPLADQFDQETVSRNKIKDYFKEQQEKLEKQAEQQEIQADRQKQQEQILEQQKEQNKRPDLNNISNSQRDNFDLPEVQESTSGTNIPGESYLNPQDREQPTSGAIPFTEEGTRAVIGGVTDKVGLTEGNYDKAMKDLDKRLEEGENLTLSEFSSSPVGLAVTGGVAGKALGTVAKNAPRAGKALEAAGIAGAAGYAGSQAAEAGKELSAGERDQAVETAGVTAAELGIIGGAGKQAAKSASRVRPDELDIRTSRAETPDRADSRRTEVNERGELQNFEEIDNIDQVTGTTTGDESLLRATQPGRDIEVEGPGGRTENFLASTEVAGRQSGDEFTGGGRTNLLRNTDEGFESVDDQVFDVQSEAQELNDLTARITDEETGATRTLFDRSDQVRGTAGNREFDSLVGTQGEQVPGEGSIFTGGAADQTGETAFRGAVIDENQLDDLNPALFQSQEDAIKRVDVDARIKEDQEFDAQEFRNDLESIFGETQADISPNTRPKNDIDTETGTLETVSPTTQTTGTIGSPVTGSLDQATREATSQAAADIMTPDVRTVTPPGTQAPTQTSGEQDLANSILQEELQDTTINEPEIQAPTAQNLGLEEELASFQEITPVQEQNDIQLNPPRQGQEQPPITRQPQEVRQPPIFETPQIFRPPTETPQQTRKTKTPVNTRPPSIFAPPTPGMFDIGSGEPQTTPAPKDQQDPFAFPDIFSVIEGETEADDEDTFTGFESRTNKKIDEEIDRLL